MIEGKIRMGRLVLDRSILKELAKAELHCHLDGSISPAAIRSLAQLADVELPNSDAELKSLITAPAEAESLMDYLKVFDFIRPLLQTKEALSLAAYDVARQAAEENVIYMEIRFAPELSMDQGLSAVDTVEGVLDGLHRAEADFGIRAKVLVCGMRQSSPDVTRQIFGKIAELSESGLAGFDFAGDEHGFPPAEIEELIRFTQRLGRPMTFHAGECGCPQHIADSIALGIKRLGHVTAIRGQKEMLADLVRNQVTAELCLTSNLQTKAAENLEAFPYRDLKEAGARITINTDNRTVSDTCLTKEYELFANYFGTGQADFYQFNKWALEAAFISSEERQELLQKLIASYESP